MTKTLTDIFKALTPADKLALAALHAGEVANTPAGQDPPTKLALLRAVTPDSDFE